ncbi:zinc transport system ATP-binding protein [Proteiniborus sp. DW1]|uniref:metal ABC transporter ATP-binding protein n=1 Tax=Proteiniborus sp. DW1 TaxID=1889883 RepID=UPI00092E1CEA|nr:metal ABC transporter ATP-binding protein [Proteiniborus sp. DW1]SCG82744.1 zinc transport system ATP-binding protein [Proteiniborus sp. DW1]
MNNVIVRVDNLSFGYEKRRVLNNISFEINKRDYVGIVGANGSAKSTLLKLMMGFLKPNDGNIKIFGFNIEDFKDWNKVGYIPQNARNFNSRFPATVKEIIGSSQYSQMSMFKVLNKKIKKDTIRALEAVNMVNFKDSLIGNLSGGQQQRVFLAKLLVNNPEVIFMDEPLIGVDTESQDIFFELIDKLNKDYGITIVLVTHDFSTLQQRANKLFCLDNGKITISNLENN